MIRFYRLLYKKYRLDFVEMDGDPAKIRSSGLPDTGLLKEVLGAAEPRGKISGLLDYLEKLTQVILSPQSFEVREDIYRKRHFTVDIPSMYGSYHELKFEALGLSFRLESLLNTLLEDMVDHKVCFFDHKRIRSGDWLSIDGLEGSVYMGKMRIQKMERDSYGNDIHK